MIRTGSRITGGCSLRQKRDNSPQSSPLGHEQLGLVFDPEAQTRRELVAERLGAEWQPTFSLTHLTINSILFLMALDFSINNKGNFYGNNG
jgi:hypothetical protein